jgi:hypothetical protein
VRTLAVHFTLLATTLGSGTPVASDLAASLARAREVRVVLTGKRIRAATSYCTWNSRPGVYQCDLKIPPHVAAGPAHPYLLTVQEKPQNDFLAAGWAYQGDPNPETIYLSSARRR